MELKEIRTFKNGLEHWDYKAIEKILTDNADFNRAWCERCGITEDDDRRVYGWPKHFEFFYAGYYAARSEFVSTLGKEAYIVTKITDRFECNIKDNQIVFNEYRNAIAYVNSLPEEYKVSYDIEDIKLGD